VTYLSRSSHLLQQGHFVADVVYYYGQDSNITALYSKKLPDVPDGYAFDFANDHALTLLSVHDGRLVTASGMSYRILALDARARLMSMDVLEQVARLVAAGATVVGEKPQTSPSFADDEARFQKLADQVWGADASGEHRFGQGRVFSAATLSNTLTKLDVGRDFSYPKTATDTLLWYVHRHLPDGDLYFVNNRRDHAEHLEASFRVLGKEAEVWHADSGLIEPASFRTEDRNTVVQLNLEANDAVFVVFRKDSRADHREVPQATSTSLATVAGPWTVHFQASRGAPELATWTALKSWSSDPTPGIKYFSGTATYQASFKAAAAWARDGQRVLLDLGSVKNIADVRVNEQPAGIVWKPPFVVDITKLLRKGDNTLTIAVTNLWPNRLIGDRQPNTTPVAFSTYNPYSPDAPLLPSGLLGPVRILGSGYSKSLR
jgi:LmbE family N-acetylglucosaminyl deacetylase